MNQIPGTEFRTVRGYQLANQRADHLTPALEDYLEMVYRLCIENRYTRVGKLSEVLHVKPSSASKMVFRLVDLEYLEYDRYDSILLTEKGRALGAYLLRRHDIVEQFLRFIGNPAPLEEAELVEHSLAPETVSQISVLLGFFTHDEGALDRYIAFRAENQPSPCALEP